MKKKYKSISYMSTTKKEEGFPSTAWRSGIDTEQCSSTWIYASMLQNVN